MALMPLYPHVCVLCRALPDTPAGLAIHLSYWQWTNVCFWGIFEGPVAHVQLDSSTHVTRYSLIVHLFEFEFERIY